MSGCGYEWEIERDRRAGPRQPAVQGEPLPILRSSACRSPLWRTTLPDKRTAWLVTRYEDVARVLKDGIFAKDRLNAMDSEQLTKTPWIPGFLKPLERNMLDLDDPDHARLRAREQGVHPTPHRAAARAHRGAI